MEQVRQTQPSQKWKTCSQNRKKKQNPTTTAERWQVSERRCTFPDTVSVASKLPTGNQNRSFLWNMCQPLVSHFVSRRTFVYCPVNKGSKLGNSRRKSFSSLFVSQRIFRAARRYLLFAPREEIAGVSANLEKPSQRFVRRLASAPPAKSDLQPNWLSADWTFLRCLKRAWRAEGGAKGVNVSQSRKHRGENEGGGWSSNIIWQKFTLPDVVEQ